MNTFIIIPARMDSKRLPGKPLLMAGGKALVEWTYLQAIQTGVSQVMVATPDKEIQSYCEKTDIRCIRTDNDLPNGTFRCAVVAQSLECNPEDTIVNWQCDEPLIDSAVMQQVILWMPRVNMNRPMRIFTITAERCMGDPAGADIVKVIVGHLGFCHWFTRQPMSGCRFHSGIYAYAYKTLRNIALLPPTPFSLAESLEQLTWLEYGFQIGSVEIPELPLSINTPEDWEKFRAMKEQT